MRENFELVAQSGKQHIRFESELKLNEKILGLEHHGYTLRAEMSVGTDKKRYAIASGEKVIKFGPLLKVKQNNALRRQIGQV